MATEKAAVKLTKNISARGPAHGLIPVPNPPMLVSNRDSNQFFRAQNHQTGDVHEPYHSNERTQILAFEPSGLAMPAISMEPDVSIQSLPIDAMRSIFSNLDW